MTQEEIQKIKNLLENHEKRITLLEGKKIQKIEERKKSWYKPSSTIEKIICLINEGFFNKPKSIGDIVTELKNRDYHLKASDLTLPLRKIVRKGLLKRTKELSDGSKAKKWHYIKS